MMGRHGVAPTGGLEDPLLPPVSNHEKLLLFEGPIQEWLSELNPHLKRLRFLILTIAFAVLLAVLLSVGVETEDSYTISKSREDVIFVCIVSSCFSILAGVFPLYILPFSYWGVFVCEVLFLCKSIAFNWKDETTSVVLITSLLCSAIEFKILDTLVNSYAELLIAEEFLSSGGVKDPPEQIVKEVTLLKATGNKKVAELSKIELLGVMKPYFWPKGIVCNLFAPIFIGRAVQGLSDGKELEEIYPKIIAFSSLVFVSKICSELQNVIYLGVKQNAFAEIAERSFAHLHSLSMEWHLKKKLGQTLRSLDRGIAAADTVVSYLFLYLVPSCFELIATALVFYHHFKIPSLSALVFGCFIAYVVTTVKLTLWRKKFRENTNKHDNDFHEKATDSLQNYETVKYFTAEDLETDRYVTAVRKYQTFNVSMQISLSILNSSQQLILQFCACSSLCIAAYHVSRQELEIGNFVSVQVYVASLFAPLSFLGTIYNAIIQAFVDMSNLSQLLAEHPDVQDASNAVDLIPCVEQNRAPTVEFSSVNFRYPTQSVGSGLKNISFFVQSGTETALVGTTGSGKSSIFRLLFRFYDPDSGEIRISGQNIRNVTLRSLRMSVGVVPQDTVLFNETILFNIKYGRPSATMEEVEEACRKAQILDRILSFPLGFDTMVGGSGHKLSGGERQRVAIARCMLKDAPILVLDEFSSALDSATEQVVHQALNNLARSRTVLVIAHRLSTVRKSDQILVLENGSILERGTHDQLLELKGRYFEMWNKQLVSDNEEKQDTT